MVVGMDAAITVCNADPSCGCFDLREDMAQGYYNLNKGYTMHIDPHSQAWVS